MDTVRNVYGKGDRLRGKEGKDGKGVGVWSLGNGKHDVIWTI